MTTPIFFAVTTGGILVTSPSLDAPSPDVLLAQRAADVMRRFGYSDVAVLQGGVGAWKAAGFQLFTGVNVPSKAFGEFVEHVCETSRISAAEVKIEQAMKDYLDWEVALVEQLKREPYLVFKTSPPPAEA